MEIFEKSGVSDVLESALLGYGRRWPSTQKPAREDAGGAVLAWEAQFPGAVVLLLFDSSRALDNLLEGECGHTRLWASAVPPQFPFPCAR